MNLRKSLHFILAFTHFILFRVIWYNRSPNVIGKASQVRFCEQALKLIHSYASEWKQFVQVDDKSLSVKINNFGVPQGSILGSVLFSLYVVDLIENVTCDSLQYVDDSTLYKHLKLENLKKCIEELESDLETVSLWSSNNSFQWR